jgi:lysozyme family protein
MANYKTAVPYFLKKEGGLSRATTDSASSNPCPCAYNGKYGWHTNKGVTWSSFKGLSGKLGYNPTCELFFQMPANIWGLIFKNGYWNFWDCDNIPYQSLADFMTWTVWGSGGGSWSQKNGSIGFLYRFLVRKGYAPKSKSEIRSTLIDLASKNEKELWLDLIQARKDFYIALNQPANYKGWMNAINGYVKWGLENYTFEKKNDIS